ncbi:MAG: lysophospholipid acyltransferase family protein [Syntrophaceae bacterium]
MRHSLRLLARLVSIPLSVSGSDNLPQDRSSILVANHTSHLDPIPLVAALPLDPIFVAKAEFVRNAWIRTFLSRLGTEFVERFDREKGVEDARRVAGVAREGRPLLFFPEGTFTRVPGLLPFHMGAFVAAAESGVPVVPMAIRGARAVLREGSWLPRQGAIAITIGKPIDPSSDMTLETSTWERALKIRDLSREHILRFCGEPDLSRV